MTLPEGKIRTIEGKVVDRADVGFLLTPHPDQSSLLASVDGTVYLRQANGSLRRLTSKRSKHNKEIGSRLSQLTKTQTTDRQVEKLETGKG